MEKIVINKELEYFLIRKQNMKRIIIRLKEQGIVVSAPTYAPLKEINSFVLRSKDRINQMEEKRKIKVQYQNKGIAKVLGKTYIIKVEDKNIYRCVIQDNYLIVYHNQIEICVKKYFKEELYKIVIHFIKKYPLIIDEVVFIPEVKIKQLTSMYGVCYYNKGTIGISLMMIHEPLWVIEYVVVHELTHFIHQNHSKEFYQTVKDLLPNYKEAILYLKQGGY